ncbi:MAG: type II secretion system F family protein, partial [Chloroflexi bacterium]|nr:type II secretion system F family protein [Chloroflexota bacterium]
MSWGRDGPRFWAHRLRGVSLLLGWGRSPAATARKFIDSGGMDLSEAPQDERRDRCRPESVVLFTRQIATMLRAGIPVTRALDTLLDNHADVGLGRVLQRVTGRVSEGFMLSRALSFHPRIFSPLFLAMVGVGETSGDLEGTLEKLATWMERDRALSQKVRAALTYPAFVLVLTAVLTLVIFHTALPGFVGLFQQMNLQLPLMTRVLILITDALHNPGTWLVGLGFLVGLTGFLRLTLASRAGACRLYSGVLALPILGSLCRNSSLARFASAMAAMISTGVPLTSCLKNAGRAAGNPVLEADVEGALVCLTEGGSLAEYFSRRPELYPATFSQMLRAGEEASAL